MEVVSDRMNVADLSGLVILRPADFRSYLAAQSNKANSSITRGFRAVRSFYRWLDRQGYGSNPAVFYMPTPKVKCSSLSPGLYLSLTCWPSWMTSARGAHG